MTKELKEYLPFYLGCEVQYEGIINGAALAKEKKDNKDDVFYIPKIEEVRGVKVGILKSIETNVTNTTIKCRIGRKGLQTHYGNGKFKLILRPLSNLTEEEKGHLLTLKQPITDGIHSVLIPVDTPESVLYLIKQGFDIFGLIEAGLAIDKNKMQ